MDWLRNSRIDILNDWVVRISFIIVLLAIAILISIHKSWLPIDDINRGVIESILFSIIEIGLGGLFTVVVLERSRRRRQQALQSELNLLINACILRIAAKVLIFVKKFYSAFDADTTDVPNTVDLITNNQKVLAKLRTELADIYNYIQYMKFEGQWRAYESALTILIGAFIKDFQSESERLFVLLEREMRESENPEIISITSKCDTYNREFCRKADRNDDVISTLLEFNQFFGYSVKLFSLLSNNQKNGSFEELGSHIEKETLDFICSANP